MQKTYLFLRIKFIFGAVGILFAGLGHAGFNPYAPTLAGGGFSPWGNAYQQPGQLQPTFSYTAQQQQQSVDAMSPTAVPPVVNQANLMVLDWQRKAEKFVESQKDMDKAFKKLSSDKTLLKRLSREKVWGPYPEAFKKVMNTIELLRLLQIQTIAKAVDMYRNNFPASLEAFIRRQRASPPRTFSQEWFKTRKERLDVLLKRFQDVLQKNPQLRTNPPAEFRNIYTIFNQGVEAHKILKQQGSCFDNIDQPFCVSTSANDNITENSDSYLSRMDDRYDGDDDPNFDE